MENNSGRIEIVYKLYKEFEEFMSSLDKSFSIPNGLTVSLDLENECIYVVENNDEYEVDLDSFRYIFGSYLEGAQEAISHGLSDLSHNYNDILYRKITEHQFIDYAGKLHLGECKLNNICNRLQEI